MERKIARYLLQINAVQLSPDIGFTWASGIQSPIYCDNRTVLSHPHIRHEVIGSMQQMTAAFGSFDLVAGVATAGIPHGAILADRMGLPFIYVRSKAKSHGRQNQIEGQFRSGQKVLLIEDLISTGGSSLAAAEAVQSAGLEVVGILAIFTYELEEAQRAFEQSDIMLRTLSNYSTLLEVARDLSYVKDLQLGKLREWRKDPRSFQF